MKRLLQYLKNRREQKLRMFCAKVSPKEEASNFVIRVDWLYRWIKTGSLR